jgi:two-component system sensor histidine kinase TctE
MKASRRVRSITRRMMVGVGFPMATLAILLGVGGAVTINEVVEGVNDRLLGASARAIAETLALENEEVTLDLPASALGMLENDARDNVYYSVWANGELLTGYPDLPRVRDLPDDDGEMVFQYAQYRDYRIRIAAVARKVPRINAPVIVEVAETLEARHALRDRMLVALAILEALLIALSIGLLPLAVRWGLAPLKRVLSAMETRREADFTPLPLDDVPGELRGLVGAFNGMIERLDTAMQGIRRFTADASHQMRTPLSILRAHVAALRSAKLPGGPAQQSLTDIEAATGRLQRLLTQLLALARAEGAREGGPDLRKPVDLVEIARAASVEHAPQAVKAGIDLHFVAPDQPVAILSQSDLAGELVGNLIDNAIRYNRAEGTVTVTVLDQGVVLVEDEGPGIAPEARATAFERFARLAPDRGREGSGLGLAIVRALADSLGAVVELTDRGAFPGLHAAVRFPTASREAPQFEAQS